MLNANDLHIFESFDDGFFKAHFGRFIEFRRGKGEAIRSSTIMIMRQINNTLASHSASRITKEMADTVFRSHMDCNGAVHHSLLSTMRSFTSYMSMIDPQTFVIPERYWKTRRIGIRTYVFSREEIERIMATMDSYCRDRKILKTYYGEPCPYPLMTRLLACTGMRSSEVRHLSYENVDLERKLIIIEDGKGHVSRLVPISDSLATVLQKYCAARRAIDGNTGFLFRVLETGKTVSGASLDRMFRKIFTLAGLEKKNGESPVVHSFRHTFCTLALDRMIAGGMHPDSAVPLLAAYVGHNDLRVTYRYLHKTDRLIEEAEKSITMLDDIIPCGEEDCYEW